MAQRIDCDVPYPTSTAHPPCIHRASTVHPPCIHRTSTVHPQYIDRTSTVHPPYIHRASAPVHVQTYFSYLHIFWPSSNIFFRSRLDILISVDFYARTQLSATVTHFTDFFVFLCISLIFFVFLCFFFGFL